MSTKFEVYHAKYGDDSEWEVELDTIHDLMEFIEHNGPIVVYGPAHYPNAMVGPNGERGPIDIPARICIYDDNIE